MVKTWLQFAFPFYLWIIVALTIKAFRHSTKLVRLCGDHSVPVLATIFLLSFTKLLRVITTVLSFTTLQYSSGRRAVWLYDGNYQFTNGGHLVLFLFSLLFLLTIGFPYSLLIFLVQVLRRYSNMYIFRWITKFMPVFDAYLGPYKHKQGYWTGLLLLIRVILVAIFATNVLENPAVKVFIVLVVTLFLILLNFVQGGVYKQTILTVLETSYIVNLGLLAASTALVRQIDGKQRPAVIYTSNAVALVTFIGTLVYHLKIFQLIKLCSSWMKQKMVKRFQRNVASADNIQFADSVIRSHTYNTFEKPVTTTVIDGILHEVS